MYSTLPARLGAMFLLATLPGMSWMQAQTAAPPPGTSSPNDFPTQTVAPDASSAKALTAKAEDAILHEKYNVALPLLDRVIAMVPENSQEAGRALYDRGYAKQQLSQPAAAEADYRAAIAANPKQFESHAALGQLLVQQQQWTSARQELELAATLTPASGDRVQAVASVNRLLARVDAELHDTAAASEALLAALKTTPEEPDDTFLTAQLAEEQGNYAGAEEQYRKVLAENPQSIPAAEGLARALIHDRKFADAEATTRKALQQEPNNSVLLAQSATALAGQGKTDAAIAQLALLHGQNPEQPAVTRMLADLYSTGGRAADAEPLYEQLIASDENDPELLTAAGANFVRAQKWPQAIQVLQRSLKLKPDQGDAWSALAFASSQNGQYTLTLTALDHRAQSLADVPATLFLRATALDHLHRTREAVSYYQKFLDAAKGEFPDEVSQTRERLAELHRAH